MTTLCYGDTGESVKKLQSALNRAGYNLTVDGVYGSNTTKAVKDFQQKHGLRADGVCGTKTWDKLSPYMADAIQLINECVAHIQESQAFKQLMELMENG